MSEEEKQLDEFYQDLEHYIMFKMKIRYPEEYKKLHGENDSFTVALKDAPLNHDWFKKLN